LALDHLIAVLLIPLACWVILNGIDDMVVDIAALTACVRQRLSHDAAARIPSEAELDSVPAQRIAVFVALWKEHRVIRNMVENNASKIEYSNFDFFLGVYPNDTPTLVAVDETAKQYSNVHYAVCPHDGPTSKADCLNWIWQRMLLFEEETGVRFDMAVIHDAEDIIDPDALRWINYYGRRYDMVQIPVLALQTPMRELLHGIYCDDFAESQFKDMRARQLLGGFMPSTGVGTGFSRRALEMLAGRADGRVFEPACLTEDYEIGVRVYALGLRQKYVPILIRHGRPIATREYFPRTFSTAVSQRSRWVMGIALQSWEFHSARETLRHWYWFWRDRKGLLGNLLTPLMNLLFLYGGATWAMASAMHRPWNLARETRVGVELSLAGLLLQILHTSVRAYCSAGVYGWRFAAGAPARVLLANWLNCFATVRAIRTYASARLAGRHLRWAKTEHRYPSGISRDTRPVGEILLSLGWIRAEELELACSTQPAASSFGEHLLALGFVSEEQLCMALARHCGMCFGRLNAGTVSLEATRLIPARIARQWSVLPYRILGGELHVATAEVPMEELEQEIRRYTSLELRFQLVTWTDFDDLAGQYLPPASGCGPAAAGK
jgi:bacteriophage N4 adsorption protein B